MPQRAGRLVVEVLLHIHDLGDVRLRVVFRNVAVHVGWLVPPHLRLVRLPPQLYVLELGELRKVLLVPCMPPLPLVDGLDRAVPDTRILCRPHPIIFQAPLLFDLAKARSQSFFMVFTLERLVLCECSLERG